jgi:phenylacetate-CoA ligase
VDGFGRKNSQVIIIQRKQEDYMKWFDWALKRKGFPIDEAVAHLNRVRALDVAGMLAYQQERKKEIVDHHIQQNAFYRGFLAKKGAADFQQWQQLPVITKADMQCPIGERLAEGYSLKNVYVNNTSGSSGVPFFFAKDRFCHALTWASNKNRFGWHGIDFNSSWQARFYGIPLKKWKFYREKLKDALSHRVRFPVFNLSDEVCAQYVEKFRQTPFDYLNGYTSSLVLFAKYCIKAGVVLKDICPSLKVCITTSEMCKPIDREIMEKGFGVKLVNEYGAAELDLLAFEDADGDWLINEENLFIEILDEHNQPVPEGAVGKIVVTALYNKAMPFIRYELGDMGAIVPGKRKGFHRILKELTGRTNDIAILPSGKKVPGLTFYYVTKSLLEQGGSMKEFVIRQVNPTAFELEYIAENEISKAEKNKIGEMMDLYLEPGLSLSYIRSQQIVRSKSGKLKQFQYLVAEQ